MVVGDSVGRAPDRLVIVMRWTVEVAPIAVGGAAWIDNFDPTGGAVLETMTVG